MKHRVGLFVVNLALLAACGQAAIPTTTIDVSPRATMPPSMAPVETFLPPTHTLAPTPVATMAPCPTESPLRVADLLGADLSCFGSRNISLVAWEDRGPIAEGGPPGISPQWLWAVTVSTVLWDHPRGALTDLDCSQGRCPGYLDIHLSPLSHVALGRNGRWVLVTGHRSDQLAETCVYVYPPDWTGERPPDQQARQICRQAFVLVSITLTTAPVGA